MDARMALRDENARLRGYLEHEQKQRGESLIALDAANARIAAALAVFNAEDGLGSASDTLQAMVAALEGEGG
jgi:hypothetical protein